METLLFSERPLDPFSIRRQQVSAGLAFEKHRWSFPARENTSSLHIFDYISLGDEDLWTALRKSYVYSLSNNHPDDITSVINLVQAGPHSPLYFFMLYELPTARMMEESRQIEHSLTWRFVESCSAQLFLGFRRRTLSPFSSVPKNTLQLIESITGYPWEGDVKPGLVPLRDPESRKRALLSLGIKGFSGLYLIALSEKTIQDSSDLSTLSRLTDISPLTSSVRINFSEFHSLVCKCDWILTTHSLYPGLTPFCFYSKQDLQSDLTEVHEASAREDSRTLRLFSDLESLNHTPSDNRLKLPPVWVSDLYPREAIIGAIELSLAWSDVNQLGELRENGSLRRLILDGTPSQDLSSLSGLATLESLSMRYVQVPRLQSTLPLPSLKYLSLSEVPLDGLGCLAQFPSLVSLDLSDSDIEDLSCLSNCRSLKKLSLNRTRVRDLGPLTDLTGLVELSLDLTQVNNLEPLSLISLEKLSISGTPIQELSPLLGRVSLHSLKVESLGGLYPVIQDWPLIRKLSSLEELSLYGSLISDVEFLDCLLSIKRLDLGDTKVNNLSPISGLEQLEALYIGRTNVSNLTPLAHLEKLRSLDISSIEPDDYSVLVCLPIEKLWLNLSSLDDISWLSELSTLQYLSLAGAKIKDMDFLNRLTCDLLSLDMRSIPINELSWVGAFVNLTSLDLSRTLIKDLASLRLPELKSLRLSETLVEDLTPLSQLNGLVEIDLSRTNIESLSGLEGNDKLLSLDISRTDVDDLSPVESAYHIRFLNIRSTEISNISSLRNMPTLTSLDLRETPIQDYTPLLDLPRISYLWLGDHIQSDILEQVKRRHRVIPETGT